MRLQKQFVVIAALATLGVIAQSRAASAADANCTRVGSYSTNHIYRVYIGNAGFGYTPWQVNPTVTVWDRCDHGGISLSVNLLNSGVLTKPGGTLTIQAAYYIDGRGWINAPLTNGSLVGNGWLNFTFTQGVYNFNHLDLCRTCRVSYVRFVTTVWTRGNNASGYVGLASKTLTLNLLNPAWSST